MSNPKKSFILHIDNLSVIDEMSDEQAGKLLKAMRNYHLGVDTELDAVTKMAFSFFRLQFERDLEKYTKTVERNKNNGLKGGRPKTQPKPEEPKKPSGFYDNPTKPKKADSDSDSDSDKKEHGSSGDKPNAKKDYPEEFEWIWSNKPEREGANPKRKAYQACSARNKQGASWREMAEGMKRYKEYCEKSKIIGTRMVQQMATFFGPDEHFKNEWEVSGGSTKGVENPQTPKYVEIDKQKAIRELEDL